MTDLERIALKAISGSYEGEAFTEAYVKKPEICKAVNEIINVLKENRLSAAESIGLMEFMRLPILSSAELHPKD